MARAWCVLSKIYILTGGERRVSCVVNDSFHKKISSAGILLDSAAAAGMVLWVRDGHGFCFVVFVSPSYWYCCEFVPMATCIGFSFIETHNLAHAM